MTKPKEANESVGNQSNESKKDQEAWRPTDSEKTTGANVDAPVQDRKSEPLGGKDDDSVPKGSGNNDEEEPPGVVGYDDSGAFTPPAADDPRV